MTTQVAKGTFEIERHAEPPYDTAPGATLAQTRFEKRFKGPLKGTSSVHMLSAVSTTPGSAGYVALERVSGVLDGLAGSFVLQHSGTMAAGKQSLSVTVVPDTGTGELRGLTGNMTIEIADGNHYYNFEYVLDPPAAVATEGG
jgi:hypothetical protein